MTPSPAQPERDHDDESEQGTSGMPEGEPELTPMGTDETDQDEKDDDDRGEEEMPGIPTEGEPDVSG